MHLSHGETSVGNLNTTYPSKAASKPTSKVQVQRSSLPTDTGCKQTPADKESTDMMDILRHMEKSQEEIFTKVIKLEHGVEALQSTGSVATSPKRKQRKQ